MNKDGICEDARFCILGGNRQGRVENRRSKNLQWVQNSRRKSVADIETEVYERERYGNGAHMKRL